MNIEQLQSIIFNALDDKKGQNIQAFDTSHLSSLFERVIIATATSNRQTRALADAVHKDVKQHGGEVIATEGLETGEWVLVDCVGAIVHIMQGPIRQYYNLEEIWGEKPIDLTVSPVKKSRKNAAKKSPDIVADVISKKPSSTLVKSRAEGVSRQDDALNTSSDFVETTAPKETAVKTRRSKSLDTQQATEGDSLVKTSTTSRRKKLTNPTDEAEKRSTIEPAPKARVRQKLTKVTEDLASKSSKIQTRRRVLAKDNAIDESNSSN